MVVFRAEAYGSICIRAIRNQLAIESEANLHSMMVNLQPAQLRIVPKEQQKNKQTLLLQVVNASAQGANVKKRSEGR